MEYGQKTLQVLFILLPIRHVFLTKYSTPTYQTTHSLVIIHIVLGPLFFIYCCCYLVASLVLGDGENLCFYVLLLLVFHWRGRTCSSYIAAAIYWLPLSLDRENLCSSFIATSGIFTILSTTKALSSYSTITKPVS